MGYVRSTGIAAALTFFERYTHSHGAQIQIALPRNNVTMLGISKSKLNRPDCLKSYMD
jgi:hypothetical protein